MLRLFDKHEQLIEEHYEPGNLPTISSIFWIMNPMDLVPSILRDRIVYRKFPLSYIIHDNNVSVKIDLHVQTSAIWFQYDSIME